MDNNFEARLKALKELTHLSPAEYVRVVNARKKEERPGVTYEDLLSGFEYSNADELEYLLRLQKFTYIIEPTWHEYTKEENDSFSLLEFTINILDTYVEENKEAKARRK